MIVKREDGADAPILITLTCLNPNYASYAELVSSAYSPNRVATNVRQQICSGGTCEWEIPNGKYRLILSAGAALIEGVQEGSINFEASASQGDYYIPPHGNSANPEEKIGKTFHADRSIKMADFFITII